VINSSRKLILLELNEINFDVVQQYISSNLERFPSLEKLLKGLSIRTTSEYKYDELEPWIQWPSVHTTKSYQEHGIYRLGDIVGCGIPQIFELLEKRGYNIGLVSAMNAENRLEKPAYFIPDPWTKTPSDGSFWSRTLGESIAQVVNDNAQSKITIKSALQIFLVFLRFARFKNYGKYISFIAASLHKPWTKALVLDLLLHDVHWSLFHSKKPNFSTLFLNAGAHIQHHYFFNSKPLRDTLPFKNPEWYVKYFNDPVADILSLYDTIVSDYLTCQNTEIIFATALTQKPYDRLKFYYRLKSHADFLNCLRINFTAVYPRMTRDFLVEFDTEALALAAHKILKSVYMQDDNSLLFGEIDNRGRSLFVTLTYSLELTENSKYVFNGRAELLKNHVSFVAIKNGMHQPNGFAFFTPGLKNYLPDNLSHVSNLGNTVLRFFDDAS
jgi:hypothetical protein